MKLCTFCYARSLHEWLQGVWPPFSDYLCILLIYSIFCLESTKETHVMCPQRKWKKWCKKTRQFLNEASTWALGLAHSAHCFKTPQICLIFDLQAKYLKILIFSCLFTLLSVVCLLFWLLFVYVLTAGFFDRD